MFQRVPAQHTHDLSPLHSASLRLPPSLWLQVQNLGFFPIHGVTMKITIPVATRGGNRLLVLRDFFTDQVPGPEATTGEGSATDRHGLWCVPGLQLPSGETSPVLGLTGWLCPM